MQVIMDLSWPLPLAATINRGMQNYSYLSKPNQIHLPFVQDVTQLILQAERGACLYSCDIARGYQQLLLDPADWLLMCFTVGGKFYMDISILFVLMWAAASYQDTTSLVTRHLHRQ